MAVAAIKATGISVLMVMTLTAAIPSRSDRRVVLEFKVVDADSGIPIGDAVVGVVDGYSSGLGSASSRTQTVADGRARLTPRFSVVGDWHLFRSTRQVSYGDRWLEVSAAGYRRLVVPLTWYTGERGDFRHPSPLPIQITLHRGKSPADFLEDLKGKYSQPAGMGGSTFVISADGRFSWTSGGCTYWYQAYGYAQLVEGELRFSPVRHDEEELHPLLLEPFIPVRWGPRRYLIRARNIKDFCDSINQGWEPSDRGSRWYERIDGSKEKPDGLPELPRRWADYLLTKPVSGKVIKMYEGGRAKVSLGLADGVQEGMLFKAHGLKGQTDQEVKVVSVSLDSCLVERCPSISRRARELTDGEEVTSRFRTD